MSSRAWAVFAVAVALTGCGAADPSDTLSPLEAERPPTAGLPVVPVLPSPSASAVARGFPMKALGRTDEMGGDDMKER